MRYALIALIALITSPAFAQLAVEPMPGVRDYGGIRSTETLPGVRSFSGAVEGTAVDIMPGATSYNLRPSLEDAAIRRAEEANRADFDMVQSGIRSRQEQQRRDDAFWDRIRNGK